ncbi:Heterokaryon incompatibility protein [Paramyrothecium foliicola]|nr:Heterokaryon incompatibility protein [Paramyrothecium foliicola]
MDGQPKERTKFVYCPLKDTEIRVVKIHPLVGTQSLVSCDIVQAPLESLSFAALSYAWGDPANTMQIRVDNQLFGVTTNLEIYMRKAATTSGHIEDEYLWIDALCIDQSNITERNAQVQRMGAIYAHARQVIVWLGLGGHHLSWGTERIRDLARTTIQLGGLEAYVDSRKRSALGGLFHETMKEDSEYRDPLKVFQAINLSEQDERSFTRAMNLINTRAVFEHGYADRYTSTRLQVLLQRTQRAQTTDPRDKIYGLLGMISDSGKEKIQPRYDASVRKVFIDTVIWHFKQYDSLSIIGQCTSAQTLDSKQMPSWVPNWQPIEEDEGPTPLNWNSYEFPGSEVTSVPYRANGDLSLSTQHWAVDEEKGALTLTGSVLGHIKTLSQPADLSTETVRNDPFAIAREWLALGKGIGEKYDFTEESVRMALRRTMVADFYDRIVPEPTGVKYKQRGFALMLPEDPPFTMGGARWDYNDSMLKYINTANKRRIAVSTKGWIGLVPTSASIGDQIAVLAGGPVLYILRESIPKETESLPDNSIPSYLLVGEAYFHGFMDGEALQGQELGNIVLI